MKKIYYKDAQGNPWVLVSSNGHTILVRVTAMDSIILTKNKDIKFRLNVLKRVRNKPEFPTVIATVFTTENGNKYVKTAIGSKVITFVMDAEDNVLKAVNEKEFEDAFEQCQLASFKPADIPVMKVVDAVFKRKEHMAELGVAV